MSVARIFPRGTLRKAQVKHVGTAAGPQGYDVTPFDVHGALLPMSRYQRVLLGGDMRLKYLFFIDDEAEMIETDLVTITYRNVTTT